jgi:hypothetical protein
MKDYSADILYGLVLVLIELYFGSFFLVFLRFVRVFFYDFIAFYRADPAVIPLSSHKKMKN